MEDKRYEKNGRRVQKVKVCKKNVVKALLVKGKMAGGRLKVKGIGKK